MMNPAPELARVGRLVTSLQGELARIGQIVADIQDALAHCGIDQDPKPDHAEDPFAFITADAEREALRLTAEHPNQTAAEIAEEVRRRLPGYATSDKGVRYYWKMARRDPSKRALLPPERQ